MKRSLVLAATVVAGCAQGGDPLDLAVNDTVPHTVTDHLVYLSSAERQIVWVDVRSDEGRVRREPLPEGTCTVRPRPTSNGGQLVVLCEGLEATNDTDAAPGELLLLDEDGIARRYVLPGRYGSFSLSEDGERAFVFEALGGIVLATETAFVDLAEEPGEENPRRVTVRSLSGEAPSGAVFSHSLGVGDERRSFAVALAPGHINVFDLEHLERGAFTVPLSVDGSREVVPGQVAFGERTLYVRARGLDHVVALSLEPGGQEGGSDHDFTLALSTLPIGAQVEQMLLLEREQGELLLVLAGSNAAVVDPSTGTSVSVATGASYHNAVRFRGGAPGDSNPQDRALLYGDGAQVAFLDLDRLESRRARNLETVSLTAAVDGAYPMVEQGRVALLHGDETLLSVVELEDRTVVPVRTQLPLRDALSDPERARLWLRSDQSKVATLSLADFAASEILLDESVSALRLVPGEPALLVAVHEGAEGFVTLLDPADPSRESARALRGFLWEDLFDERTSR